MVERPFNALSGTAAASAPDAAVLGGLVVQPKFRRRGVARQLVAEAEAQAASWGYDEVVLTVLSTNTAATSLYQRLGYQRTDGQPLQHADADTLGATSWWQRLLPSGADMLCLSKVVVVNQF